MEKEIVIVGSGRSLLERGLGKRIDSISEVLRFNPVDKYLERHYVNDIGSKMTKFCFNFNTQILEDVGGKLASIIKKWEPNEILMTSRDGYRLSRRRSRGFRKILSVLKVHGDHRHKEDRMHERSRVGRNCSNAQKKLSWKVYSQTEARQIVKTLKTDHHLDDTGCYPVSQKERLKLRKEKRQGESLSKYGWHFTSGLMAICNALYMTRYDKIYICGFDMVSDFKEGNLHGHFFDQGSELYKPFHRLDIEALIIKNLISLNKIEILK